MRLNRNLLPLHKPEACSNTLRWTDLALKLLTLNGYAGFIDGLSLEMLMEWSLTYVVTPIAVAVRVALFISSVLSNSTSRGVLQSLPCTASMLRLGSAFSSLGSSLYT